MSHVVLLISPEQIKAMKSHYSSSLAAKQPPGSIFSAKPPLCTVTAYKSGKVLFQGKNAEIEAVKWQKGSTAAAPKKNGILCIGQRPSIFAACKYRNHVSDWFRRGRNRRLFRPDDRRSRICQEGATRSIKGAWCPGFQKSERPTDHRHCQTD